MERRVSQLAPVLLLLVPIIACGSVATNDGVVFESDWSTATGTSRRTVTDGGRWRHYDEWNHGSGVQLLSVVTGGPGGRNALRVMQRGSTYAAALQQDNVLPPSTDFYVRFYMRNDDTSPGGDHIVVSGIYSWEQFTYIRRLTTATTWRNSNNISSCGSWTYPIGHWYGRRALTNGQWYRFEYYFHYVDATHMQVHQRIYDASGALIMTDADIQQEDYGSAVWNGSNTWTLASYYAAGNSFCVNPTKMTSFSVGNNGQLGAADTGLSWYFAGVQIRTDRWAGP